MDLNAWLAQIRKGAAEMAVLLILERGEQYGLEIISSFDASPNLGVAEGTVYPLLSRLSKAGRISSRWVTDGDTAHARKYYQLTEEGRATLAEMRKEWARFRDALDDLCDASRKGRRSA
ncbi:MAG: PadR family transcriptional regulator [Pseudomonadota bacterium]